MKILWKIIKPKRGIALTQIYLLTQTQTHTHTPTNTDTQTHIRSTCFKIDTKVNLGNNIIEISSKKKSFFFRHIFSQIFFRSNLQSYEFFFFFAKSSKSKLTRSNVKKNFLFFFPIHQHSFPFPSSNFSISFQGLS